ncbi:MAG: UDP-2,4-diacetamido-2,4,6-trideoxy-beta-L-altropyranose hydrolase [Gammaproteobacteria bacterium]|nr:UDP-2,4-diacetamido-2,4,6-trideoxy-beta-L-altropyranose hydrolase [Gammaproteobacteria bacterium]
MKKFAFRVDAALHIGIGHVMRCLTLAASLRALGHQSHFICREHLGHLNHKIQSLGFTVHTLPAVPPVEASLDATNNANWLGAEWTTDAQQTSDLIQALQVDWLITDHYALDRDWEQFILDKHTHLKIMVIDDLANRHHQCHLLLDQNLGRLESDYSPWVGKECRVFAGAEYVLLRSEFSQLREYSIKRRANARLQNILISMGGIDNDNATALILRTLKLTPMPASTRVTVILGDTCPHIDIVKAYALQMPYVTNVVVAPNNIAQLMADSDLAIGAAGSTSWERCHMGLPSLLVVLAENQQTACDALLRMRAALVIGKLTDIPLNLPNLIQNVLQKPHILKQISNQAASISNHTGLLQIINQMLRSINER